MQALGPCAANHMHTILLGRRVCKNHFRVGREGRENRRKKRKEESKQGDANACACWDKSWHMKRWVPLSRHQLRRTLCQENLPLWPSRCDPCHVYLVSQQGWPFMRYQHPGPKHVLGILVVSLQILALSPERYPRLKLPPMTFDRNSVEIWQSDICISFCCFILNWSARWNSRASPVSIFNHSAQAGMSLS